MIFNIFMAIFPFICWNNSFHDRELTYQVFAIIYGGILIIRCRYVVLTMQDKLALSYIAVLLISFMFTNGSSQNYNPLIIQLSGVSAYFLTRDERIIPFFAAGGFLACLSLLYYRLGTNGYINFWGNKNIIGMFIMMNVPCVYYCRKWLNDFIIYALCIIMMLGLFYSGAKGAVLAFMVQCLIIGFYKNKYLIFVPFFFAVFIFAGPEARNPIKNKIKKYGILTNNSITQRIEWWKEFAPKVFEHPITGGGIGNLTINSNPETVIANTGTHNLYMSLHSYGGVFALFAWFAVVIISLRRSPPELKAVIIGYMIYAFFSGMAANHMINLAYFWGVLGATKNR